MTRSGIFGVVGCAAFALSFAPLLSTAAQAPLPHRRAIIISFDGFSEPPVRKFSDSLSAPAIWGMFRSGICAASVRPAFPSVTPTSHASIWTGAYSNVTGISASANGALPLEQTTILDRSDGFSAAALRAEPIWISAARQRKRVFSQMATQSPGPPGYPRISGADAHGSSARAAASRALNRPATAVVNIYPELFADSHVVRAMSELSWAFGKEGDSLHAMILDDSTIAVHANRNTSRTVRVRVAAADTTNPRGRPLARFFSKPLEVDLARGRRTFVYFRLFDLSRRPSRILLFASEARVTHANQPRIATAYDRYVRGVQGNGASRPLERGEFGARVPGGGDGSAEYRYMETVELVVRQFMRGTEWGFAHHQPELTTDYLPYPDEALHTFLGYADESTPNVSAAARANAAAMLKRAYTLIDLRLEQLIRHAREHPETLLLVTGEHGMRPTWLELRPNVLLRHAGLLAVDARGRIDLSRTFAAVTRGGWVSVNRKTRKAGIVSSDSVDAVLTRVELALKSAKDESGRAIVTSIWRAASTAGDSLGIGGPSGGDLYFGLAPDYYWSFDSSGASVVEMDYPKGEHGFPSTDPDMQPLLCAVRSGIHARRIGTVRSIDIAPTASAWVGIKPPRDARGRVIRPVIAR